MEFEKDEMEFLGFIIGKGVVKMDPGKVGAIKEWKSPKNKKELQSQDPIIIRRFINRNLRLCNSFLFFGLFHSLIAPTLPGSIFTTPFPIINPRIHFVFSEFAFIWFYAKIIPFHIPILL